MDYLITPEQILQLHKSIRRVALSTENGDVLFLQAREALRTFAPSKVAEAFMKFNPLMIIGACQRQTEWWGPVESVQVNFDKLNMLIVRSKDGKQILTITMNKDEATREEIAEIVRSINILMDRTQMDASKIGESTNVIKCPHCGKLGLHVEIRRFDPEDIVTCSNCGKATLLVDVLPLGAWYSSTHANA